jgi:hypothetical protein
VRKLQIQKLIATEVGSEALSILAEMFHGYGYGYPLLKFLQS